MEDNPNSHPLKQSDSPWIFGEFPHDFDEDSIVKSNAYKQRNGDETAQAGRGDFKVADFSIESGSLFYEQSVDLSQHDAWDKSCK